MKKALIAMSGGVDSSVAAWIMKSKGYECMGATMKLYDSDMVETNGCSLNACYSKTCCSLSDVEDAKSVAARIGIPYHVFNYKDSFQERVIEHFVCEYEQGNTPNPCIDCNRYMKFEKMMDRMRELQYDYLVTGHYARVEQDEETGRFLLKKALDDTKDQSYVLYHFTQEQLAHTLFPLGEYTKKEIRVMAEENHFINAKKHDSQDICFVPDGDYASFIERYRNKKFAEGNFVLEDGTILGKHKGMIHYTIGQRRGLGIAYKESLYVLRKDIERNEIILGSNAKLFQRELDASDINLIAMDSLKGELRCKAKIRYGQKEAAACVTQTGADTLHVVFDEPQRGITSGQAVVFYDGDLVLGGGTIL